MRTTDMTLFTNGETVWTYERMRGEVFPAEVDSWTWTSSLAAS